MRSLLYRTSSYSTPAQSRPSFTWSNASGRSGLSSDPIVSSKTSSRRPWYRFVYASFRTNARALPMCSGPLGYGARRRTTFPSTASGSGGRSFGPGSGRSFSQRSGGVAPGSGRSGSTASAVAPGNVGPFHIAPRCPEIESWRSRRDGSINIDTDFLRETPLWKPFCTPNHILSLVGRRGAKVSLRQRAGLASAVWAVAFSLLAVVAATPKGPTAMLSVDDVTPVVGQIVHFDASGSVPHDEGKGRIVSYEFDFGDGNHTREQSSPFATHAYSLVGPKRATVDVEDARGNDGSASVRIDVQPKSPPTGAPDLTPSSASTIPAQPIEGQIAIVSIILANHWNATAAGATIDVTDQRPNGTVVSIGTASLSAPLEPEASVVVYSSTFVAIEVGNHTLYIAAGNVTPAETDVEDNTLTIGMTVLPVTGPPPGGVPDLAPESAVTIPTQPVEGESVSLSITVVNRGSVAADAAIIEISDVRPNGTIVPIGTSVLSTPLGLGDSVVVDSPSLVAAGGRRHPVPIHHPDRPPAGAG